MSRLPRALGTPTLRRRGLAWDRELNLACLWIDGRLWFGYLVDDGPPRYWRWFG